MMWLLGRKEESESALSSSKNSNRSSTKKGKRRRGIRHSNGKSHASAVDKDLMHVAESENGIEVSLSQDQQTLKSVGTMPTTPTESVVSLSYQIAEAERIYRAQFNVQQKSKQKAAIQCKPPPKLSKVRNHRVPLFQRAPKKTEMLYDDVLFLLRSYDASDELSVLTEELKLMNTELHELSRDRADVEQLCEIQIQAEGMKDSPFDVSRQLKKNIPKAERSRLQHERGTNLTLHLESSKAQEALLSKCGHCSLGKKSPKRGQQQTAADPPLFVTIGPHNCRDGGGATTMQQIALLPDGSFFLSRDGGSINYKNSKSFCSGRLPERLYRRLKNVDKSVCDLEYLSTGPGGSYYAEFRSSAGECWWGSAGDDTDFFNICREWDVHRVVFGPCSVFDDPTNGAGSGGHHAVVVSSWIVLSKDGRAAWKNLPARLHNMLESRIASDSAIAEVALGHGGSYFVRFVDDSKDWQLPARIAKICDQLEKEGRTITSMSLHPELSHDFVIRHR